MPLANHISGPIGNGQADNSNSTNELNNMNWTFMTENNIAVSVIHSDIKHLPSFSTSYGHKYQHQNGINILNSMDYYEDVSLDNNSTKDNCHDSNLGSLFGKNSVKRIPVRVWLTVSWILTMCSIGRFV